MVKTYRYPINWNFSLLLPSGNEEDFQKERKIIEEKTKAFVETYRNDNSYLTDPGALKEALDTLAEWAAKYSGDGNEGYYFGLKSELDQNNTEIKAKENKAGDFALYISNQINFFEVNLSKIPEDIQESFLQSPTLIEYHHYLERLFAFAKHILTEDEEKIMSLKSRASYGNWIDMLNRFLAKEERKVLTEDGKNEKLSFAAILGLLESKDRKVRESAANGLNSILDKNVDVAEAEINSVLQDKKVSDEIRHYSRPDEARIMGDDMDIKVVEAVVKSVSSSFAIAQNYYSFKAKLMGVDKLKYYDRNAEYGEINETYDWDEAAELVHQTLDDLSPIFGSIMMDFLTEGHYDVFPYRGKDSGAFCASGSLSQATYILLNFTGKVNDLLTLAHETGHGINNELMRKNLNGLNFGVPMSTAEVASTFMEDFVLQRLLQDADDEVKLSLMVKKLDEQIATIFRQIAFYNFETDLHKMYREKGYLTKEEIGELFLQHMTSYMGEAVELTAGSQNWWMYVSHFRSYFYVYSYASGLLISKSLQFAVRREKGFIDKVIDFLSAGSSASPKDIFKNLGIDITSEKFWEDGLKDIDNLLQETTQLAKKLGKI